MPLLDTLMPHADFALEPWGALEDEMAEAHLRLHNWLEARGPSAGRVLLASRYEPFRETAARHCRGIERELIDRVLQSTFGDAAEPFGCAYELAENPHLTDEDRQHLVEQLWGRLVRPRTSWPDDAERLVSALKSLLDRGAHLPSGVP
jgi:hypothetical protein